VRLVIEVDVAARRAGRGRVVRPSQQQRGAPRPTRQQRRAADRAGRRGRRARGAS